MKSLALLLALLALSAPAAAREPTAGQLIAKVEAARATSGFRARARLTRTVPGGGKPEVKQLLIKGRRKDGASKTLYLVLWPKASEGEALVVETSPEGKRGGFLLPPSGQPVPLGREEMAQPLFGSDVTVEDVAESFWHWPSQTLAGEETVAGHPCKILESRPAAGADTAYSLVRSWVATDLSLPLRVDKFGKGGRLLKRFVAAKLAKLSDGTWSAAILVVDAPEAKTRTVLEGTRSDRGIEVPPEQFTPEGIRRLLAQP